MINIGFRRMAPEKGKAGRWWGRLDVYLEDVAFIWDGAFIATYYIVKNKESFK